MGKRPLLPMATLAGGPIVALLLTSPGSPDSFLIATSVFFIAATLASLFPLAQALVVERRMLLEVTAICSAWLTLAWRTVLCEISAVALASPIMRGWLLAAVTLALLRITMVLLALQRHLVTSAARQTTWRRLGALGRAPLFALLLATMAAGLVDVAVVVGVITGAVGEGAAIAALASSATVLCLITRRAGVPMPPSAGHAPGPINTVAFAAVGLALLATLVKVLHTGQGTDAVALASGLVMVAAFLGQQFIYVQEHLALTTRLQQRMAKGSNELAVRQSMEALVQNSSDVVMVADEVGTIRYASTSIEPVFGLTSTAVVGRSMFEALPSDDHPALQAAMTRAEENPGQAVVVTWRLNHANGDVSRIESLVTSHSDEPSIAGFVLNSRDITERSVLEEQLEHQAFHDSLTGLANRSLFKDRLDQAIHRWHRSGEVFAVLFCDLDSFKAVNDSIGHNTGDQLLKEVAQRLIDSVRTGDTVARFGGDEFALLLQGVTEDEIEVVSRRVTSAIERSFTIDGLDLFIGTSIGVVTAGGDRHEGSADILRKADLAMYVAKSLGRNRAIHFEPSMQAELLDNLELTNDLRQALEHNEMAVHYQPILDLVTNRIVSVEALVRWHHPIRGNVPPSDFIPLSEENGMILPLGEWVLRQACLQLSEWRRTFGVDAPGSVSVNISGRQLQERDMVAKVAQVLEETGLPASALTLEVTESVLLEDINRVRDQLERLHLLGVTVAVDDFGTGYSSLNYLQEFPIDILKIDRSFVSGIGTEAKDSVLAHAVMTIGQMLKLRTVAEGIEQINELGELKRMGCDMGQGFLFAAAVDSLALSELLVVSGGRRAGTPA